MIIRIGESKEGEEDRDSKLMIKYKVRTVEQKKYVAKGSIKVKFDWITHVQVKRR